MSKSNVCDDHVEFIKQVLVFSFDITMAPSPQNSGDDGEKKAMDLEKPPNIPEVPQKKRQPVENDFHKEEKRKFTFKSKPIAQPTDAMAGDNYDHGYNQENRYQVLLIQLNVEIQHHSFCQNKVKAKPCDRCSSVEKLLHHQALSGCISKECFKCQLVQKTMEFHKTICQMPDCSLCADNMKTPASGVHKVDGSGRGEWCLAQSSVSACLNDEPERVCGFVAPMCQKLVGTDFKEGEDYELLNQLGEGGNGKVFNVKLLLRGKEKLPGISDLAVKMTTVTPKEIKALKNLSDKKFFLQHFFVVHKEEIMEWKNKCRKIRHRVFFEKLDTSLSMYRKSKPNGVLGVDKAMYYWIQILLAVHQLHTLVPSIMHKDIKSGNVLLTNKNKEARLADFEYAVVLEKDIDTTKLRPCGTRFFCAPEVKQRKRHGTPADIYSMGAFGLELLIPNAISYSEKGRPIEDLKRIDHGLGLLMESCLREDPSERPTAQQLLNHEIVQHYIQSFEGEPFMNGVVGQLR